MTGPKKITPMEPRTLTLTKQGQRWVFRYAPGEESAVLKQLAATAADPDANFDWFDAAVLSHQLGNHMSDQLKSLHAQHTP